MKILNKIIMFSIILFLNKSISFCNNRLFIKKANLNTYKNKINRIDKINKIETQLNSKKSSEIILKSLLNFEPKTENQKYYYNSLNNKEKNIFICYGPAGTGKSFISCVNALSKLEQKEINKIIITRPAISVENEEHGFLPGDINKKMSPWISPILDIFDEFKGHKGGEKMLKEGSLNIIPLAFMRGRTFKNSVIIADEMQNSSPKQMLMLLTRLGENSKIIINGDLEQSDINIENGLNNLIKLYNNYKNLKYFEFIQMTKNDIQRSKVVEEVYELYNNKQKQEKKENKQSNYVIDYCNSNNSNNLYDYNDYNEITNYNKLDELDELDDWVNENETNNINHSKKKIIKIYSNSINITNSNNRINTSNSNDDSALIPIKYDYFYKRI